MVRKPKKKPEHRELDQAIALRLRWLRRALSLNHAQIARRIGVSRSTYTEYERGTFRIPVHAAILLKRFTHASLEWIYEGEITHLSQDLQNRLQVQADRDPRGTLRD